MLIKNTAKKPKLSHWLIPGLTKQGILQLKTDRMRAIAELICKHRNISLEDLKSPSRKREIAEVRQICMYFISKKTDHYLANIGKFFNRDHSSVIYSKSMVENLMFTNKKYKQLIEELDQIVSN